MPRDEKGRFIKEENDFILTFPNPFSIIKYLILCLVLYPWYKILGSFISFLSEKLPVKKFTFKKMVCNCPP